MEKEKKAAKGTTYTPVLPYDITVGEDHDMYQHFTYHRDISLFDNDEKKMERGNVIHSYRCNFKDPLPIGGDPVEKDEKEADFEASENIEEEDQPENIE